jgi:hypothetical protein
VHLATFSNDIVNAIKVVFGDTLPIEVCALENNKKTVQLQQGSQLYLNSSLEEYQIIAEEINERKILVCIQHEFGLFWGIR